jgi:tetratricopeptide (TPR) repeat protein
MKKKATKAKAASKGKAAAAPKAPPKAKAKPASKAKPAKAKPAPKAAPKAKPASSRAAAPKATAKPAPKAKPASSRASAAKPKAKPEKAGRPAPLQGRSPAASKASQAKASRIDASQDKDLEVTLAPEHVAKTIPESVPAEDEGALRNVMASLTSIFGGRDFLSDAELDAFLDDKIATGEIPPSAALDPLDEAQSLIYEAWNSEPPQKVRLAKKALELTDDCADAYVLLAEHDSRDTRQSLENYRKGMAAGERAVDPKLFREAEGDFWAVMETRPYMRARLGVAECLWELGQKDEALGHLRDMLRLNPSDNQGVRYILAQILLETGEEGELHDLVQRFPHDDAPQIRYSHALLAFRHEGRGAQADGLLAKALKANPHVPAYLLRRKKLPAEAPAEVAPGSEEEAAAYAMGAQGSWQKTLGAAEWLAERTR